jgi:hypothetical protein
MPSGVSSTAYSGAAGYYNRGYFRTTVGY